MSDFPAGSERKRRGEGHGHGRGEEYAPLRGEPLPGDHEEGQHLLGEGAATGTHYSYEEEDGHGRESEYLDASSKEAFGVKPQVINLGNTIVGAGLMALPKVVQTLGIVTGVISLFVVLMCTIKTLNYMLVESTRCRSTDFAAVVRQRLGTKAAHVLDFSIVVNNVGLLIIYLRIIGDVLVGNAEYKGIITDFMSDKSLLAQPYFSVGIITFGVLLPLCSLEKMDALAAASASGLALALLFSLITIILSLVEISHDGLKDVSFGPNPLYFHGGFVQDLLVIVGVFPVIFTSLVCHYNLLHVKEDLPRRFYHKMPEIVKVSGCSCVGLYCVVASFGYILFKDDVQGDVLLNFGCDALERLVGSKMCIVIAVAVRSMYALVLSMTFPLIHFALRQTESTILLPRPEERNKPVNRWGLTLLNLVVSFVVAMEVPNIWTPLQITGAVAAGIIGFIIPSLLHLNVPEQEKSTWGTVQAYLLLSLGVLVGVVTIYQLCTGNLS
ncbi:amino acid transporter [Chloropicon primus]|uniref:Amino acid transporter n=1 Tax=Chloropicon primus TaxID=1764295 RepID=A0A5B8MT87_9CHLO|nr:amino acid transporter [Chloropicon primus]UPR02069.1 amino acid transporter [Chloropicon primus]|eukprot:QDZ22845.1 amino acid transporter [Chloropicon primus]